MEQEQPNNESDDLDKSHLNQISELPTDVNSIAKSEVEDDIQGIRVEDMMNEKNQSQSMDNQFMGENLKLIVNIISKFAPNLNCESCVKFYFEKRKWTFKIALNLNNAKLNLKKKTN